MRSTIMVMCCLMYVLVSCFVIRTIVLMANNVLSRIFHVKKRYALKQSIVSFVIFEGMMLGMFEAVLQFPQVNIVDIYIYLCIAGIGSTVWCYFSAEEPNRVFTKIRWANDKERQQKRVCLFLIVFLFAFYIGYEQTRALLLEEDVNILGKIVNYTIIAQIIALDRLMNIVSSLIILRNDEKKENGKNYSVHPKNSTKILATKEINKKEEKADFISMCDDLKIEWTERKKNNDSVIEYELAKEAVVKFVGKDRKKLLQLKAEAKIENFFNYQTYIVSFMALIISFCSLYFVVVEKIIQELVEPFGIAFIIGTTLSIIFIYWFWKRYVHVNKWRNHIQVAIEDFEQYLAENENAPFKDIVEGWKNKDKEDSVNNDM